MKTAYKKSFAKDLKRHSRDQKLLDMIKEVILEVETAGRITDIDNLKKLRVKGEYYRIRSGDYRIGLIIDGDTVTFVRALHRSEIYRYFP
ncbi:MAG: plasmid stabilization protein [Deltaproteobacteria bacterium RIFOXYD12_FULL_57_12]|nr:MAG: plasmid stabilization protein [Deltaproteobacteria bacterium RIFOXYD12_FULL_57_12]